MNTILPTTLVGSYPQPDWLIDRGKLGKYVPRVRAQELWRVGEEWLDQAQNDATLLAIRDQETAGVDILTDGEMRRESYSNRFATALEGVDIENPGTRLDRTGKPSTVPRVAGPIRRKHPVEVRDVAFLRANTTHKIKITVPGAFTMAQQAQDDFYKDEKAMAMGYAAALNEEIKDLFSAGADIVQIDEPYMQSSADKAREYGVEVINRALDGVTGQTALHICFGYGALVKGRPDGYSFLAELEDSSVNAGFRRDGAVEARLRGSGETAEQDNHSRRARSRNYEVETPELVAERIRRGLAHVPAERLVIAPDCGMKYLPRDVAFGKLKAMVEGAAIVRREVTGS